MRSAVLIFLFAFVQRSFSQDISGVVVSDNGGVVVGARVEIPELHRQTFTSDSGKFSLHALSSGFVSILVEKKSYKFYFQSVSLPLSAPLMIRLTPENQLLDEVVVYGSQKSNKS